MRLLRDANISLCLSDHHDAPAPWRRTADFVYVRGHGPGGRYKDNYPDATLEAWAKRIRAWASHGIDVYAYFDNDQKSAAPADALRLRRLLAASSHQARRAARASSSGHRAHLSV